MTIGGCLSGADARSVGAMDTRALGYLGLGVLVGIVVATLIGLPPGIWIATALVTLVGGTAVMLARSDGSNDAVRMLSRVASAPSHAEQTPEPAMPRTSDVGMELVRPADRGAGTSAVWLHRRGGRRVHRFETATGWVLERVSTNDPDNPRKRVIGEPLAFAREAEAIAAADELAQGRVPAAAVPERPALAGAEA